MKKFLRVVFAPILNRFETGPDHEAYVYKPLNRKILIALGIMSSALGIGLGYVVFNTGTFSAILPVIVFLGLGIVCLVVGTLGTDEGVSRLWGYKG